MKKFLLPVTAHSLVRITSRGTIEISARNKEEALRIARELMEHRLDEYSLPDEVELSDDWEVIDNMNEVYEEVEKMHDKLGINPYDLDSLEEDDDQ